MSETWIRSNARKSPIRPRYTPPNGVDLNFGERIIFEHDGQAWEGLCQGWRLEGERAIIKTDLVGRHGRVDLPIDKIWRIWDARDDRIAELEAKLSELKDSMPYTD